MTTPSPATAFKAHHLIAIDTQQQIANLLPIVELGARRVWTLASAFARRQGWPKNLKTAAAPVPVVDEELQTEDEVYPDRVSRIALRLVARRGDREAVAFAWGGGQKPHSVGLWLAFSALSQAEPEAGHLAVYVEQNRGRMLVWTSPAEMYEVPLRSQLTFDQLLHAAGMERKPGRDAGVSLVAETSPLEPWVEEACGLFMRRQGYRRFCFEWAARLAQHDPEADLPIEELRNQVEKAWRGAFPAGSFRPLVEQGWLSLKPPTHVPDLAGWASTALADKLLKDVTGSLRTSIQPASVDPPDDAEALGFLERHNGGELTRAMAQGRVFLGPGHPRFGPLFEQLVAHRVHAWAASRREVLAEVLVNVKLRVPGSGVEAGEFDVAILTRKGVLIVLDAKTFTEAADARKAQTLAVQTAGGSFAQRHIVIPAFAEDIGAPQPGTAPTSWGAQPWYPRQLGSLIARAKDTTTPAPDRPRYVPFDGSDALERELDRLCGA